MIRFLSLIPRTAIEIERRERCPVDDQKLVKDVMKMPFDRTVRDVQPSPNRLIRSSFAYQTQNLPLTGGQHCYRFLSAPTRRLLQNHLTRRDLSQALHESVGISILTDDCVDADCIR